MQYYKTVLILTLFLWGTSTAWTSEEHLDNVHIQPMRAMGFNPTSQATKDLIKERARNHLRVVRPNTEPLPSTFDMSRYCIIMDQGDLGSCTANAISGQLYMRQVIQLQELHKIDLDSIKKKVKPTSRLFIYWGERNKEGTVDEDAGASLGDGMLVVYETGAPREKYWPYDDRKVSLDPNTKPLFMQKPSEKAFAMAKENRDLDGLAHDLIEPEGKKYNLNTIKRALFEKQPLAFGMLLYESFMSETVKNTGKVTMPKKHEQFAGGHAVLMVGYDDHAKCFKVANSWGVTWGDKGFFYVPYKYFTANLVSEIWKIGEVTLPQISFSLLPKAINDNAELFIKKDKKVKKLKIEEVKLTEDLKVEELKIEEKK